MKATDYILTNNQNKTFPFGVEIYITHQNKVIDLVYEGFATISSAFKFVEETNQLLKKQR